MTQLVVLYPGLLALGKVTIGRAGLVSLRRCLLHQIQHVFRHGSQRISTNKNHWRKHISYLIEDTSSVLLAEKPAKLVQYLQKPYIDLKKQQNLISSPW